MRESRERLFCDTSHVGGGGGEGGFDLLSRN